MRVTQATLLNATPGRRCDPVGVENFVNHHGAGVDALSQAPAARYVAGPDTCGQTVYAVVRKSNRLFVSLEGHDWQHWTEGFIAHHVHVVVHVDQDCWLKESPGRI